MLIPFELGWLHCLTCFKLLCDVLEAIGRMQSHFKVSLFLQEEDNQTMNSKDIELTKRLKNQNRRVIASMRGGRKSLASRNTYKDKGRRSSHNSKIQKQLSNWWSLWRAFEVWGAGWVSYLIMGFYILFHCCYGWTWQKFRIGLYF